MIKNQQFNSKIKYNTYWQLLKLLLLLGFKFLNILERINTFNEKIQASKNAHGDNRLSSKEANSLLSIFIEAFQDQWILILLAALGLKIIFNFVAMIFPAIEEKLLVLSENDKGWTKELNRVSFNGAPAKYDIRTWSPDHTKMGKGITLSNEEFQVLVDAFKN